MKPYYERGGITIYHGDCEHRSGAGMCANCQPAMFPTAAQIEAGNRWLKEWRVWHEFPVAEHLPTLRLRAPQQPKRRRRAAASPDEDEDAWQELGAREQFVLSRIVDEGEYGYDTDDLGPRLMPYVLALQALGYVGIDPDTGRWVAGKRGRSVAALRR